MISAAFVLVITALVAISGTTLVWMLHAWTTPEHLARTRFPDVRQPRHRFSLLVPAYNEETVLRATLERLLEQTHPDFEIVCIVREDDPATAAVAEAVAARSGHRVKVVRSNYWPRNKPAAMNLALPECNGDIIGIFDAEDVVHPELLRNVDSLLQDSGADIVQSGVQLMNFWTNWYSVRNVLEYYFWFRSRLHFHAAVRFIPLGGNTVFLRADVLREAQGWDDTCLAEDCEVGVRLSSTGHKVAVAYDPALVTREETPPNLTALFKQRTRWNQGFLQVLRKGEWRRLDNRRRRLLALYTLSMPFLQAFTGMLFPVAIVTAIVLKLPMVLVMYSFVPLMLTLATVLVEAIGLFEFGRLFERKVRLRDYARLVIGTGPYQMMLAAAATRAVWRELRGEASWEKTAHVGAHLEVGARS